MMIAHPESSSTKSWTIKQNVFPLIDVCGRFFQVELTLWADLPVSAIRNSQVVPFSRTHYVHLNPRFEGIEIVCPQFFSLSQGQV